jgi:hypothetical protein
LAGKELFASAIPPQRKGGDSDLAEVYGGMEGSGAAAGFGWRRIDSEFGGMVGGFILAETGRKGGI